MQLVCKKGMCTGCMACEEICPRNAVKVVDDIQEYNALIDEKKCVNCNMCKKVCQNENPVENRKSIGYQQGWICDETLRKKSSSGGAAVALAQAFIKQGGIVYSCIFKDGEFCFEFAKNAEDCKKFQGSKYVKSNPIGIYDKIKKMLINKEKVLFIGLPCQVAALLNFVGQNNYQYLYTVDLICHGTPSPKLLSLFLDDYKCKLKDVGNIQFRKGNQFLISQDGKLITNEKVMDLYTLAYLNGLDYTNNCYSCKYARPERVSDVTIGDSWGSNLDQKEKGISLLLCQTRKGKELINMSELELFDVDYSKALESNMQLRHPSEMNSKRQRFFTNIKKGKRFKTAYRKCYPIMFYKQELKNILLKFGIMKTN